MATTRAPDGALEYNRCEYLLVWSWRLIVAGRGDCPWLACEFERTCQRDAGRTFAALCCFLGALARAHRQRLTVNPSGCFELTADESRMLALVAAAQAGNRGVLDAHLCWLARPDMRAGVHASANALAAALSADRLRLPQSVRTAPDHAPCPAPTPAISGARVRGSCRTG